jgi:RNA polymerase sigma factor (sigma-70 family)
MRTMGRNPSDTAIGDAQKRFPTTIWSDLLALGNAAEPEAQERLNRFFKLYWKPVYAFVRTALGKSGEDSKDFTQAFFTHLLERGFFGRAESVAGSFRSYLKQALRYFVIDLERGLAARRPEKPLFSLDAAPGDLERMGPAAPDESPERSYDREWFRCLLDLSLKTLESTLESEGKTLYFSVFRAFVGDFWKPAPPIPGAPIGSPAGPTYRELAARLEIRESDVRNYLSYCRRELRRILKERIREYVDTEEEAELELRVFLNG